MASFLALWSSAAKQAAIEKKTLCTLKAKGFLLLEVVLLRACQTFVLVRNGDSGAAC